MSGVISHILSSVSGLFQNTEIQDISNLTVFQGIHKSSENKYNCLILHDLFFY